MRVGVIVQARMSSTRLPGKVLMDVRGRPMLWYLLESLRRCGDAETVAVATSVEPSDDPIEAFCEGVGVACVRGPLDDVAGRFLLASRELALDAFVRICGDSPLLDYRLVDKAVGLFRGSGCDLVTNVARRTFPKGQSVEVVRSSAFEEACRRMERPEDREHVTKIFYSGEGSFSILPFESGGMFGEESLVVDTGEDMARVAALIAVMTRPHWEYGWDELVGLARRGRDA